MPASQPLLFPDPRPLVERLGRDFFRQLTGRPGVYLMRDAQENILYVGKAKNLKQRLNSYRVANPDRLPRRQLRLLRAVARIELQECPDETSALVREGELLLALKPKFNRVGVWPATPRFLVCRCTGRRLELAITEAPTDDWQDFGPFGGGVVHLRAALARLLWYALNAGSGSVKMPEGWMHGRLGAIATIIDAQTPEPNIGEVQTVLKKLFDENSDGFVAWIGERTKALVHAYDLAMRDADLETVDGFMRAKTRRTLPFAAPDQNPDNQGVESTLPFTDGDGKQP